MPGHRSGVFFVNFEHVLHILLVFQSELWEGKRRLGSNVLYHSKEDDYSNIFYNTKLNYYQYIVSWEIKRFLPIPAKSILG